MCYREKEGVLEDIKKIHVRVRLLRYRGDPCRTEPAHLYKPADWCMLFREMQLVHTIYSVYSRFGINYSV